MLELKRQTAVVDLEVHFKWLSGVEREIGTRSEERQLVVAEPGDNFDRFSAKVPTLQAWKEDFFVRFIPMLEKLQMYGQRLLSCKTGLTQLRSTVVVKLTLKTASNWKGSRDGCHEAVRSLRFAVSSQDRVQHRFGADHLLVPSRTKFNSFCGADRLAAVWRWRGG